MRPFLLIFLIIGSACATTTLMTKTNAPFDGKRFDNLEPFSDKSIWTVIKWQLSKKERKNVPWPEFHPIEKQKPEVSRSQSLKIAVINHATVLIQIDGINILTDPHYSERASPVSWAGPKRVIEPAINFDDLPPIDVVLISHNHYDHLDLPTLKRLKEKFSPVFLVGLQSKTFLEEEGLKNIVELDWWIDYSHPNFLGIKFTFVPAQHWSARSFHDRREMLWGGFTISASKKIYFAGDTGYGKFLKQIREKIGAPDVALLPIGAYEPRWFMKDAHMNPDEAVQAMLELEAKAALGIHFGTFKLTDEGREDPMRDLAAALLKHAIPHEKFRAPTFGQTYSF